MLSWPKPLKMGEGVANIYDDGGLTTKAWPSPTPNRGSSTT